MQPEPRAVLFDLDDTLYPLEQFLMSGFHAVAAYVAMTWGHDPGRVLRTLSDAYATDRGRELDVLVTRLGLPDGTVPRLVDVLRGHGPRLRLSGATVAVLAVLRRDWRIGVVTNGRADIQARKVAALGLAPLVDTVVLAAEHGSGAGKPEAAPFLSACLTLGVAPGRTVFVGDDLRCDIAGAHALGMKTIWLPAAVARRPEPAVACADLILPSLAAVPAAAEQLIALRWSSHVA